MGRSAETRLHARLPRPAKRAVRLALRHAPDAKRLGFMLRPSTLRAMAKGPRPVATASTGLGSSDEFLRFAGRRTRNASASAVAWLDDTTLSVVQLARAALVTFEFRPEQGALVPVATAPIPGLENPDSVSLNRAKDRIAVSDSATGRAAVYGFGPGAALGELLTMIEEPTEHTWHGIALSGEGDALYVTSVDNPGAIRVFRLTSGPSDQVEAELIQVVPNRSSPAKPKGLAITADGRFLVVSFGPNVQRGKHQSNRGRTAVFGLDHDGTVIEPERHAAEALRCGSLECAALAPDDSKVAVTDQAFDQVAILEFDRQHGRFGGQLATIVGPRSRLSFPHGIAWSPSGRHLAVTNYGTDTVAIYEVPS